MSKRQLESYKRVHDFANPRDIEEGKIKKEKNNHIKYSKKSSEMTKNMLRSVQNSGDFDDFFDEEIAEMNLKAATEKGNAATHKKRLKKLQNYDEFK